MPPPKAIVCHLCNGKYFSRSWPIHLKACEAKWKKTHSRCEYCGVAVNNQDWSDHRSHCKPSQKRRISKLAMEAPLSVPVPVDSMGIPAAKISSKVIECEECEAEDAMWRCQQCEQSLCAMCDASLHRKGARSRHTRDPLSAKALRAEKMCSVDGLTQDGDGAVCPPVPAPKVDGRTECKFCGRKFNPQRAEKHMRICSKATKKNSKRKMWDGAKKRIEGTDFLQYQYNRSSTPEKVKQWKKEGRRWREESSHLRQGAGADPLDLDAERKFVEKRMKFRLKGYGRGFEAKDEEAPPPEIELLGSLKKPAPRDPTKKPSPRDAVEEKTQKRVFKKAPTRSGSNSARSRNSAPTSSRGISGISGVSARGSAPKRENASKPQFGSNVKKRQRPTSNTSSGSVSSKGSGRFSGRTTRRNPSQKTIDPKGLNVKGKETTASSRVTRAKKKPGVPRFGRNRSTADIRNDPNQSKVANRKPTFGAKTRNVKSSEPPKPRNVRSSDVVRPRVEKVHKENVETVNRGNAQRAPVERAPVERVQKEITRKTQKPTFQRAKSEANELPRGIDLGVNVKKVGGDGPKSMDDYLARERARRQQRKGKAGNGGTKAVRGSKGAGGSGGGGAAKQRKTSMSSVTKKMSRLQLDQAELDRQQSIQKISKPTGSKDLSSKRAAYFDSLLQHQE